MSREKPTRHGTGIQWCHVPGYKGETWNPTTGCSRVSKGCDHCYAFQLHDQRYAHNRRVTRAAGGDDPANARGSDHEPAGLLAPQYDRPFSQVQLLPDRLEVPLRARKPRAYFVDSMSDLFHEDVPDEYLARVFAVMALSPQHLFLVLTKRPERMRSWFLWMARGVISNPAPRACALALAQVLRERATEVEGFRELVRGEVAWPLPNVWLGVSTEDQGRADERVPLLLDTPAAVRFVSAEPLLGPIDFNEACDPPSARSRWASNPGLDWVIVGGESGPHARPMDLAWARSIVKQCQAAGVAAFVKQLGARPVDYSGAVGDVTQRGARYEMPAARLRLKHSHGGDIEEFPEDLRVREFPVGVETK